MTRPVHITATGDVGAATGGNLMSVTLTAGSDAATLTLRQGGAGGATILVVKAAANTSFQAQYAGLAFSGQLHATLAGTGPVATAEL